MATKKPVSLESLLSRQETRLGALVRKAAAGDALTRQLLDLLPPDLRPHLVAARTRDSALVLIVDSAAWAPRFRFLDVELRAGLETRYGLAVSKLLIKVRPAEA